MNSKKPTFSPLDSRVKNLLHPNSVISKFDSFSKEYQILPKELYPHSYKSNEKLFFKVILEPEKSSLDFDVFVEDKFNTKRRIKLSFLSDPNPKLRIFSVLKKLIGKDLTKFALPASLCEPLSMLQRTSEIWEYRDFLKKAIQEKNPVLRFAKVFGFLFIPYACTENRMKKPFNPLLGETFEYEIDGIKVLSEQVSHHPPITAFHVESSDFVCWGHLLFKTKLTGLALDVTPEGGL